MSEALLSSAWYRVATLRPRLRSHARLHRHVYRGERWYVLRDEANGRCHRLSNTAHLLIGWMDGERSTDDVWNVAVEELGDDAPTQDEVIRLLGVLHAADALASDVAPDLADLFRRQERREAAEGWGRLMNPLSLRVARIDPDAFLTRWEPRLRPLFTGTSLAVCGALTAFAALLALANASELAAGASDRFFAPGNLLLLGLVYPVMKLLHELGHAFAAKTFGCEVREMGVLLLVLVPMPYVDASAVAVLPDKRRRMAVSAAGILVEVVLASLALFVWLAVEPGLVRAVAYNVMFIGGLSTLLFNGNPLMKFDGYYVLLDALEIPNLAQRAQQYVRFAVEHHAFGLQGVRNPVNVDSERFWLAAYGVCSFVYRQFLIFGIALLVAGKLFFVGVLIALFSLTMQVVLPLLKGASGLLTSPRFGEQRPRALGVTGGVLLTALLLLAVVPFPLATVAEGVIWPPERAHVRAGADGFVMRVVAAPRAVVAPGDPLLVTRDPLLEAKLGSLEARLKELRARHHAERRADLVQAQITSEEIQTVHAELARAREQAGEVVIRSPGAGTFVPVGEHDWLDRFIRHGELVGYVVGPAASTVRVAVGEDAVALVRARTEGVALRRSSELAAVNAAAIAREVPAASDQLPSAALGTAGGGSWPVDPSDPDGVTSLVPVFQFDIALGSEAYFARIGERVHVRFDHGSEPLAPRLSRALRRLFLGRFRV